MIANYFKTARRNLLKSKLYSAINILGLAAGLSSFILILLYLNYELSYDKWNPELKKVIKVSLRREADILPQTPAPLASFLVQNYFAAEAGTRFQAAGDIEVLLAANDKKIYQKGMVTADSSFLKVFPYKLINGNAATALNPPDAVIISEELSRKLFGDADPVGKRVKSYNIITGVITGVFQEPDGPSHLNVQIVMRDQYEKGNNFWENYSYQTYIKLKHSLSEVKIEDAINRIFYNERLKESNKSFEEYKKAGQQTALFTDAVPDIHNFPKHGRSNFITVSVLLILAVLLLLAGAINFSNLDIAKAMGRSKEVGVRKILGSGRWQLIFQFMSETAFYCIISLCIAVLLVYTILPDVNRAFNITLSFRQQGNTVSLPLQIGLCLLFVTLLSGLYPSLVLSRFNSAKVLKGDYSGGQKSMFFRNSLIVVQFMVSVFFIIAVLVISNQMRYMQNKDKGFSGTQVMRIQPMQKTREEGFAAVRNTLLTIPGVSYVAKTTTVPGDNELVDTTTYEFKCDGSGYRMASVKISTDYFKTLQIALVKGRMLTEDYIDQNTRMAIINESAARRMNTPDPVGKIITYPGCDSVPIQIAGVVKDFNVQGFESVVQPVVYTIGNKACMYQSGGAILIKLNTDQMQSSVAAIEQAWKKIEPDVPIRYSFLDDNFQQLFLSYIRLQKVITFFALIAILISAMGLFALTAFFAKQRTKEIGIRKVLGAGVSGLAALLSKDFIRLVIIAVIITVPVAAWALNKWLQTFAYRISISWWMFLTAGIIVAAIAVITVSFQAIKTALTNPVKSLRSE
jgi:putative ABC transport system permease protein